MVAALASMTGFARVDGSADVDAGMTDEWHWELRSVNGRGLELRFRLPAGLEGMESALKAHAARALRRGTVQAGLTVTPRQRGGGVRINRPWLDTLLALVRELSEAWPDAPAPRLEFLLGLPGVLQSEAAAERAVFQEAQQRAIAVGFGVALERLVAEREAEGARLGDAVRGLLDQFGTLLAHACTAAAGQAEAHRVRLKAAVEALLTGLSAVPEDRLAQEVALLAARSDVLEELDRLASHLAAARTLIERGGQVGRDLDFLVQEFGREINTLCSKSAHIGLTGIGLQMKAVMEQVREQVQNFE